MPLTKPQLDLLDAALATRQNDLMLELAEDNRQRTDPQNAELQQYGDEGDKSIAITSTDLALAEMNRHIDELKEIDATRRRMAEGEYGVCEDCGVDILFRRLQVMPTARRCAECQEFHDRTHQSMETPSL